MKIVTATALASLLATAALAAQLPQILYRCGEQDMTMYQGDLTSFVTQAEADDEGTLVNDIALHIYNLEERMRGFVTCDDENCQTPFPTWDCTPFVNIVPTVSQSYAGFDQDGNIGWYYVFSPTDITLGCSECLEI